MLLEQIFDALEMKVNFNESVEKFFLNFSVANMAGNETQRELQTMI